MKSAIVCHHTADSQKTPQHAKVKAYHNAGAGGKWPKGHGIQYHAFIDTDAEVHYVKNLDATLWHSGDAAWNKKALAVCFAADLRLGPPTPGQQEAFLQVMDSWQQAFGIADKNLRNHRDIIPNHTECPGMDLVALLHELRLSDLQRRMKQAQDALRRIKSADRKNRLTRFIERLREALKRAYNGGSVPPTP